MFPSPFKNVYISKNIWIDFGLSTEKYRISIVLLNEKLSNCCELINWIFKPSFRFQAKKIAKSTKFSDIVTILENFASNFILIFHLYFRAGQTAAVSRVVSGSARKTVNLDSNLADDNKNLYEYNLTSTCDG